MRVRVKVEHPLRRGEMRRLKRSAARMLKELFPSGGLELSIALVDETEIKRLNSRYLHRDEPTDVLAFPQMSPGEIDDLAAGRRAALEPLGDIVICVPVAERQAKERGSTEAEELELLAAHGLLHLGGYDDETGESAAVMAEMEMRLLGRSIIG